MVGGKLSELCARVEVSSGLQATFTGRVILSTGSTLPDIQMCFVMRDIFHNV